jgi:hypothetical protein
VFGTGHDVSGRCAEGNALLERTSFKSTVSRKAAARAFESMVPVSAAVTRPKCLSSTERLREKGRKASRSRPESRIILS